jgi:hypothetical protein
MITTCPICGSHEVQLHAPSDDEQEGALLPSTRAECLNERCFHEWNVVTHRDILRALPTWNRAPVLFSPQ